VRRELAERWPLALDRFRQELEQVAGVFHVVAGMDEAPEVIGRIARERGARRVVTWSAAALGADLAPGLSAQGLDATPMPDDPVSEAEQERLRQINAAAEIGVTGADLAIAETGSFVLRAGPGRPRTTSLLPEYHVAIFDRRALVETLEQAGVVLEAWHAAAMPATAGGVINFVTGPSRTADIELSLTRGVHGPRELHAIFIQSP
jgi:L-lactate dehydrogenase complex protein LldG